MEICSKKSQKQGLTQGQKKKSHRQSYQYDKVADAFSTRPYMTSPSCRSKEPGQVGNERYTLLSFSSKSLQIVPMDFPSSLITLDMSQRPGYRFSLVSVTMLNVAGNCGCLTSMISLNAGVNETMNQTVITPL